MVETGSVLGLLAAGEEEESEAEEEGGGEEEEEEDGEEGADMRAVRDFLLAGRSSPKYTPRVLEVLQCFRGVEVFMRVASPEGGQPKVVHNSA